MQALNLLYAELHFIMLTPPPPQLALNGDIYQ